MTSPPASSTLDPRLKRFLVWFSLLLAAGYTFLDYWNYNRMGREDPREWTELLAGRGIAPAQYRVGVLRAAALVAHISHLQLRHGFALIDFACLLAGLGSILYLLTRTPDFRTSAPAMQWGLCLLCFTVFEVYLFWTFWFQKPETMATFAFFGLSALAASKGRKAFAPLMAIAMVVMAILQATIRADAAVAFHLGMLLACLLFQIMPMPLGRALQIVTSTVAIFAAASVQWLIVHRIYPGAQRNVSAFQLIGNLHSGMGWLAIVLSLAPYGVTLWLAARHWHTLGGWSRGLILGSVIHFAMFYMLGMAEEVRIFLPFAMAVLPVSVPLLAEWLHGYGVAGTGPVH